jgi:thioredoxin reductase (NADPH)
MVLGGLASTTSQIDNFPGFPDGLTGLELCRRLEEQAKKFGLKTVWGNVSKLLRLKTGWAVEVDGQLLAARAVILATGTESAKLGIPGEDQFRGKGVSYCATCDGPFYKDKNVLVVGGGNSAIEEALFLTRYAAKISIVHRRDVLRADQLVAALAMSNPQIYFFWHTQLEEISGQDKVTEATLLDLANNKRLKVPVDGIFIYIGSKPNSAIAKDFVKLDPNGYIITDQEMKTASPGLLAAGDVRAKTLRQVVTAAADGALAADSARKYLESLS